MRNISLHRMEHLRRKNESKGERRAESGDYVLPDSDTKLLTDADVSGLSAYDLYLARNEIFARHGRMFENIKKI